MDKYLLDGEQCAESIEMLLEKTGASDVDGLKEFGISVIPLNDTNAKDWAYLQIESDEDDEFYDIITHVVGDYAEEVSRKNADFLEYYLSREHRVDEHELCAYIAAAIVDESSEIDTCRYVGGYRGNFAFSSLNTDEKKIYVLNELINKKWEVSHDIDRELRMKDYPFGGEDISVIKILSANSPIYLIYERDF